MNDPRIAVFIEAERKATVVTPWPKWRVPEDRWAAILAALPPDWCGHSSRDREDEAWFMQDEIARLRKIEEAARAALIELDIIRAHHPGGGPFIVHIDTHADLRAALEVYNEKE